MIAKYHCPNPTKILRSVTEDGHEKSLLGKHASLEGKLYSQEENVAEADKVNMVCESEIPICIRPPTIAKRWGDLLRRNLFYSSAPQLTPIFVSRQIWESMESLQFHGLVSSLVIQVKISKGDLSQRINCCLSNEGTDYDSLQGRWTGHQCHNQDSESVVVVGVTTHQGDGRADHRAKGLRLGGFNMHRYRGTDSLLRGDIISTINVSETLRHSEYPNCRAGTLDALKGACPVWEGLC
jgi:hypothetical protein